MSRIEKRLAKLLSKDSSIKFSELKTVFESFGYSYSTAGKTSGSRCRFYRNTDKAVFTMHEPHPDSYLKEYQKRYAVEFLKEHGDIYE